MTEQRAWAISVTVLASEGEVDGIVDRIGAAICGSLDHPGACTNPWDIMAVRLDDLDEEERARWIGSAETLMEQRRHEHRRL